ncbi:hypothetical protein IQ272_06335 [Chroococcidiopsidales cyanobacterium LEGE 13417]|nr:hypothetical protein [Chroococcidiopsidales cyanobacterium LEGE 13417]
MPVKDFKNLLNPSTYHTTFLPEDYSSKVNIYDFAGHYSLYHDGWYGSMVLVYDSGQFHGTYNHVRDDRAYKVTASVEEQHPYQITFIIHKFNQNIPTDQVFTGYLFAHGKNAIAGQTTWRGQPFGFFARKSGFLHLSDYGDGSESVLPKHFAGSYSLYHDGQPATLELAESNSLLMSGIYRRNGVTQEVVARVSSKVPHEITISIYMETGEFVLLTGYLFTRPKNAIAGYMKWGETQSGFYMIKYS